MLSHPLRTPLYAGYPVKLTFKNTGIGIHATMPTHLFTTIIVTLLHHLGHY